MRRRVQDGPAGEGGGGHANSVAHGSAMPACHPQQVAEWP